MATTSKDELMKKIASFKNELRDALAALSQNEHSNRESPVDVEDIAARAMKRAQDWIASVRFQVGTPLDNSLAALEAALRELPAFQARTRLREQGRRILEKMLLSVAHAVKSKLPSNIRTAGHGDFTVTVTPTGLLGRWPGQAAPLELISSARQGQYAGINLVYHEDFWLKTEKATSPPHTVIMGLEYLYGQKKTLNGALGQDDRLLFAISIIK